MSWPQWQGSVQPPLGGMPMVNSAPPVINPSGAMPMGMQYTPEQWQQMQQQNWQQWAQWQQQYQQWHQQYGAEYQKSISALGAANAATLPPMPNTSAPPPLPEQKPPLPPEEPPSPSTKPNYPNNPTQTPSYTSTQSAANLPNSNFTSNPPPNFGQNNFKTAPPPTSTKPQGNPPLWQGQPNMSNPPPNYKHEVGTKRPLISTQEPMDPKRNKFEQNWQSQPPPNRQQQAKPEELSESEKKFMKQFAEWEAQFNKWKEQNQDHPDKAQYKEYEKKWETWRNQLLERREQMRRRRLGLLGNQTPPEKLTQKPPVFEPPLKKVESAVTEEVEASNSNSFLQTNKSGGIPGLDLVDENAQTNEKEEELKGTEMNSAKTNNIDLEAISKNINSILGDQKILSMLSLVTKNPNLSINKETSIEKPIRQPSVISDSGSNMDEVSRSSFNQDDSRNQGIFNRDDSQNQIASNFEDSKRGRSNDPKSSFKFSWEVDGENNRNDTHIKWSWNNDEKSNETWNSIHTPRWEDPKPESKQPRWESPKPGADLQEFGRKNYPPSNQKQSSFEENVPKPVPPPRFNQMDPLNKESNQSFENYEENNVYEGENEDYEYNSCDGSFYNGRDRGFNNSCSGGFQNDGPLPFHNEDRHFPNENRSFGNDGNRSFENEGNRDFKNDGNRDFGNDKGLGFPNDDNRGFPNGRGRGRGFQNEGSRGFSNDGGRGFSNEGGRGFANDGSRGFPNDGGRGFPNDGGRGFPSEGGRGFPNNGGRGFPNDGSRGFPNDGSRGFPNDGGKGFPNEADRGFPNDDDRRFPNNDGRVFANEGGRSFPLDGDQGYNEGYNNNRNYNDRDDYDVNMHWEDPQTDYYEEQRPNELDPNLTDEAPNMDDIMTIEKVIDYDHTPKKPTVIDVSIEPPHLFDYRHKPVNRIPLPERPKWIFETFRNIPEFQPSIGRLNIPSYRYAPIERFEYRSSNTRGTRYDNYSNYNRRSFEDQKYYDERKPHYEERPSHYEERSIHFDDHSSHYEERSSHYEERDRLSHFESRERTQHFEERERAPSHFEEKSQYDERSSRYDRRNNDRRSMEFELKRNRETNRTSAAPPIKQNVIKTPPKQTNRIVMIDDILSPPGRYKREPKIAIILRGPPGSGKTFLAKLIKDKEVENGGSAPRILSLDDYFMVEQEKEVREEGKLVKIKEMVYEYEECMESSYRTSLLRSFKKTITDGYFPFIIVDNVNDKIKYFDEMWSFARQNGFQVYICQLELDVQICSKRNVHNRSEKDIEQIVAGWESTPSHYNMVDATSLIQAGSIPEVEMEEINSPNENFEDDENEEQACISSKWDNFECSIDNLAKLDGISKPLRSAGTMEDYLQLDEWTEKPSNKPGQKRVRWADLEERKEQEKMRAIGFVVGQTDWDRMMDPTQGGSALTKTKYIERVHKY